MLDRPDCDISVEGGVWTTFTTQMGIPNGNFRGHADKEQSMQGAFGFMLFSNVERLQIRNMPRKQLEFREKIINVKIFRKK